ncbi:MAG: thiamine diphosphokinase [Clostridia bacterium]|nr:thiamine diphosphokinase [Clostridia bacterium]
MTMMIPKEEKTCYIFAAAPISDSQRIEKIEEGDLVIAADGGYDYTSAHGIAIDVCLGDFDSLGKAPRGDFELLTFPVRKDDTDMGLAVKYGLSKGFRRFVMYGGLGGERRSHTLSNCQTLSYIAENGGRGYLVENENFITAISSGQSIELSAGAASDGAKFSVFAMSGRAEGVTIENAQYEIKGATLTGDYPIGAGNGFVPGKSAVISVEKGNILIVYEE